MSKLFESVILYFRYLISAPSKLEMKLREFEHAERQFLYHDKAAFDHADAARQWVKIVEKSRSDMIDAVCDQQSKIEI